MKKKGDVGELKLVEILPGERRGTKYERVEVGELKALPQQSASSFAWAFAGCHWELGWEWLLQPTRIEFQRAERILCHGIRYTITLLSSHSLTLLNGWLSFKRNFNLILSLDSQVTGGESEGAGRKKEFKLVIVKPRWKSKLFPVQVELSFKLLAPGFTMSQE